jgi:gamma-glutamyltranspeptidase
MRDGSLRGAGDRLQSALADALDAIAREGVRLATHGEIAQLMVEAAKDGGHLTRDDFAAYEPLWRSR